MKKAKKAIKWRSVRDYPPYFGTIALVYSQIDGFGLAEFSKGRAGRWLWLHKSINNSSIAKDVTHWVELEIPK